MSTVLQAQEPSARYLAVLAPPLVRHFDLLATAPGGVARLRELILTLAVQGRLLPQDCRDEPVALLLQEIAAAKSSTTASPRRGRSTEAADDVIGPFDLPSTWAWVWLGEVTQISGGVTLGRKGSIAQPVTLPYLRVANVQRWRVLHDDLKTVTIGAAELPRYQLNPGDLLITEGGDWDKVGRTAIWRGDVPTCLHQNHVFKARGVTPTWNAAWAELYLNSPVARAYFAASAKQTTNLASINMTQLKACPLPLPPLAEQARIVARVDELMRLCDALEAKGRLEAQHHGQLLTTLLGTLTDSSTPEELAANWQRVADCFDVLLDRPEAVELLERTILQLAVRGTLVRQDVHDDSGPDSLGSHRVLVHGSIAEVKHGKPMPEDADTESTLDVPAGWIRATISDLCSLVTDGEHATPQRCEDRTAVPLVTAKNVRSETMDYSQTDFVPRAVAEKCWNRCKPQAGDILMVSVGATLGRLCVLRESRDMVLVRSVTVLRPIPTMVTPSYLALHLMAPASQSEIWASVKQR